MPEYRAPEITKKLQELLEKQVADSDDKSAAIIVLEKGARIGPDTILRAKIEGQGFIFALLKF